MSDLVSIADLAAEIAVTSPSAPDDFGPAPQLLWLEVAALKVDRGYQRPIGAAGRANIRAIAEGFRWPRFSAVIVAPVEGGGYTVVDGQHRVIAALLAGIERVPAQVIRVDRRGQAQAFAAINGRVARMSPLATHKAAAMDGDRRAVAIERVAAAAGVTVLAYPKSELNQKPGETMAIAVIGQAIDLLGEGGAAVALAICRRSAGDRPGYLLQTIIKATVEHVRELIAAGVLVADAPRVFAGVDLIHEYGKALAAPRGKGEAVWSVLLARLRAKAGSR